MHKLAIAVVVAVGIGGAHAQQRNWRDMMNDMKARYAQTFEQCQALATSRGYRLGDGGGGDDGESRALMMFIEGCIMGQQRCRVTDCWASAGGIDGNARERSRAPSVPLFIPAGTIHS